MTATRPVPLTEQERAVAREVLTWLVSGLRRPERYCEQGVALCSCATGDEGGEAWHPIEEPVDAWLAAFELARAEGFTHAYPCFPSHPDFPRP